MKPNICEILIVLFLFLFTSVSGQDLPNGPTRKRGDVANVNAIDFGKLNIRYASFNKTKISQMKNPIILYRYNHSGCSVCSDSALQMLIRRIKQLKKNYRLVVASNAENSRVYQILQNRMDKVGIQSMAISNIPIAYDSIYSSYFTLIDIDRKARFFVVPLLSNLKNMQETINALFTLYDDQSGLKVKD